MDNTETMRKGIAALEKHTSLRQISLQSGINYITLRKIKLGETKNVSAGVAARFEKFQKDFDPAKAKASASKPGPKPKAAKEAKPAAAAKKKSARKTKAAAADAPAAPAKKKPGRPKKAAAAAAPKAAAPAKKKPGRPKKAAAAAAPKAAAPAKKKAGRPKKAAAKKAAPAQKAVAEQATNFGSPFLGDALAREIEIAEARIEYLKSLQMVEEEFLKAIGKK